MNFAAEFAFATLYTNLILYKENPGSLRLSFEQEVRIVEWLTDKSQLDSVHSQRAHINIMQIACGADNRISSSLCG
jgi:hypothetical protein